MERHIVHLSYLYQNVTNNSIVSAEQNAIKYEEHLPLHEVTVGLFILLALNATIQPNKKSYIYLRKLLNRDWKLYVSVIVFYIFIVTLVYPIAAVLLLLFSILRKIVKIILILKLRNEFGGLLEGGDAIWTIEDGSKCIINILIVIDYNEDERSNFYLRFYEHLEEKFKREENKQFWKLFSSREKLLGYAYLRKNAILLNDCIKTLPQVKNEDELQEFISVISNSLLPKDHHALWDVYIGNTAIQWRKNRRRVHPVLFRFHHSLGDGILLLKILSKSFHGNHINQSIRAKILKSITTENFLKAFIKKLLFIIKIPIIIKGLIKRKPDDNILHGAELSGKKCLVWFKEDNKDLVERVKILKGKYKVSFFDILLTNITSSITQYFERNNSVPDKIHTVIPVTTKQSIDIFAEDTEKITFGNTITVGELNLPMHVNGNLYANIMGVKNNMHRLMNSRELEMNYLLIKILSKYIPEQILGKLLKVNSTMIISNVPGSEMVNFSYGSIEDIIFWIPHRFQTGIAFSIFTYDNRFQIGLSVDKALIANKKEVEGILVNVVDCLKRI